MSEDTTRDLSNTSSFEERVLSELAAIRQENSQQSVRLVSLDERVTSLDERLTSLEERMISLEDKVDARLRETRPIWEGVQQRLTQIESALSELNRQLKTLIMDSFKLRVRVEKLEDNQPAA
jgi:predicted nuclease with TOPRIM domain